MKKHQHGSRSGHGAGAPPWVFLREPGSSPQSSRLSPAPRLSPRARTHRHCRLPALTPSGPPAPGKAHPRKRSIPHQKFAPGKCSTPPKILSRNSPLPKKISPGKFLHPISPLQKSPSEPGKFLHPAQSSPEKPLRTRKNHSPRKESLPGKATPLTGKTLPEKAPLSPERHRSAEKPSPAKSPSPK